MRILGTALLAAALGVVVFGCKKREPDPPADAPPVAVAPPTVPPAVVKAPTPEAVWRPGTFTIGKSTTYITSPLTATGHVDYVAALNARLSKGVTPETNANVALWRVIGPTPAGDKVPSGYFEKMGVTAPPAIGGYFVGQRAYADRTPGGMGAPEVLNTLTGRPWTRDQSALIAGWLELNEKPLDALREAVKRPKYYSPLIPAEGAKGTGGLFTSPSPGLVTCRGAATALACRAMLHLGENRSDQAWMDVLACFRLGRLTGHGGTLLDGLLGPAIEAVACQAAVAFLAHADLDKETVAKCLQDLHELPRRNEVLAMVDFSRFSYLDHVMQLSSRGPAYLAALGALGDFSLPKGDVTPDGTDWDTALESGNVWFDQLAAAVVASKRVERVEKLGRYRTDLRSFQKAASEGNPANRFLREGVNSSKWRGELMAYSFASSGTLLIDRTLDSADRGTQAFDTLVTAFALVWHQRTHGRYPDSLAKLAPTFLTAVPGDLFSEKALIYKPEANGFLLYSVGVNGADDGGRGPDQPPADDIAVRIPLPPKP